MTTVQLTLDDRGSPDHAFVSLLNVTLTATRGSDVKQQRRDDEFNFSIFFNPAAQLARTDVKLAGEACQRTLDVLRATVAGRRQGGFADSSEHRLLGLIDDWERVYAYLVSLDPRFRRNK